MAKKMRTKAISSLRKSLVRSTMFFKFFFGELKPGLYFLHSLKIAVIL